MIATLVCLLAGAVLFGVASNKQLFVRLVGPTLTAQYRLQKRLPNAVGYAEKSFLNMARIGFILLGGVLIGLGLIGVIALA